MASGLKWLVASVALSSLFLGGERAGSFIADHLSRPHTHMRFDSSWGLVIDSDKPVMLGAAFNWYPSGARTRPSTQQQILLGLFWLFPDHYLDECLLVGSPGGSYAIFCPAASRDGTMTHGSPG